MFVSRHTSVRTAHKSKEYHSLICCSASKLEKGDSDDYVQGAGDDIEYWANGLTAQVFWQNKDLLLNEHTEEKLCLLIDKLVREDSADYVDLRSHVHLKTIPIPIFIGRSSQRRSLDILDFNGVLFCDSPVLDPSDVKETLTPGTLLLNLSCPSGKLGGQTLRKKLPLIDSFVLKITAENSAPKILVLCSTGRDLSIGVALAILCRYVDDDGKFRSEPLQTIDKNFVRRRLACFVSAIPEANPSRATLQSVNTYLMSQGR